MANKIKSLKQQRNELLLLAKKQRRTRKKLSEAKNQEQKLRGEIKALKAETGKNVVRRISRTIRAADTPVRREQAKRTVKKLKKGFAAFQKFADRFGD